MKKWLPCLAFTLCASTALAEPPDSAPTKTQKVASALVKKKLVDPLAKAQSKRRAFSRAAPPPKARRVRVLDPVAQTDARGKKFVRFAIDERHRWNEDASWRKDAMVGCAYPEDRRVFVKQGDGYVPAKSMLGGDAKPQRGACEAAPADGAKLAQNDS